MCGIVGVAGKINYDTIKVFDTLLDLDTTRGSHSTGIVSINSRNEKFILKNLGTPWDLRELKGYNKATTLNSLLIIGHNRYATKGKVNKFNAHPFEFSKITGVHNGTLNNSKNLKDWKKFEVDSENLYYHMNENGVEDTISKLDGAFALSWVDEDNKTLNFIRNKERPLKYCYSKDGNTLFWASEEWMLTVACGKNNVKIEKINDFEENILYTFKIIENDNFNNFKIVVKPTIKKLKVLEKNTLHIKRTLNNKVENINTSGESERVKFYIHGESKDSKLNKLFGDFLFGVTEDDNQHFVKLHPTRNTKKWKELLESVNLFSGEYKSVYNIDGNKYLTIDLRTLREEDDVYNTEISDNTEKKYCSWCIGEIKIEDNKHLEIQGSTETVYLCEDCSEIEELKDLI